MPLRRKISGFPENLYFHIGKMPEWMDETPGDTLMQVYAHVCRP